MLGPSSYSSKDLNEGGSDAVRLIFLTMSFDLKEWHTMFMKFYQEYDKDENMTFDLAEITGVFEKFAGNEWLGRKKMTKVLKSIGANITSGLLMFFKEGG